ncbi:MAG: UDP-N-acetylmuramate dehydrogenase [Acidimicrobiia bacterium]|nr:UDP-N-acetylmuramate dehydrogenase [Acidimicrobiia bacterium]
MSFADLAARGLVERNRSLAGMTTYKFGGPAAWYAEVGSTATLRELAAASDLPIVVIGRGSNMVIADDGYPGLVIKLSGEFNEIAFSGDKVRAGAAVSLPRLARACAAESMGGLEFYVGIPGSVGGAVVMNAGGHGSDTAEWLVSASIFDTQTGKIVEEETAGLDLRYRHSRLTAREIVLGAQYRTVARSSDESEAMMREITSWRREYQPGGTFNAGSVFKNPPGDAAGRLIDDAGLKGERVGGVAVSDRHANFFVAEAGACAQDVYDLVHRVRERVADASGILLEPEVRFVGDFGTSS